jgi:hypothetical protein
MYVRVIAHTVWCVHVVHHPPIDKNTGVHICVRLDLVVSNSTENVIS